MATRQPTKAQLEQNIERLERVITQLVTGVEPTAKLHLNLMALDQGNFKLTANLAQNGEIIPVLSQNVDVRLTTGDTLMLSLNIKDCLLPIEPKRSFGKGKR